MNGPKFGSDIKTNGQANKWLADCARIACKSLDSRRHHRQETVVIYAVTFILLVLAASRRPELARGLRKGLSEFLKATEAVDREIHDAGMSLGGILGKFAAQALTPDNQTAELYDPAIFDREKRLRRSIKSMRFRRWSRLCRMW